jgi:hypothetical protein
MDWNAFQATSDKFEISLELLIPASLGLSDSPLRNWSLNKYLSPVVALGAAVQNTDKANYF